MAHRFIILGNDFLPVNTRAEQLLAGRALNKVHPEGATVKVWQGDPHFASDETGDVLDSDGEMFDTRRRFLHEDQY